MPRDKSDLLYDIQEAATYIVEDTSGSTEESFLTDRRMRQLVERNFLTIGEAVNQLRQHYPEAANRISDVNRIVGFRNILIHDYETIDPETVWNIVQAWLPALRAEIDVQLRELTP